MVCEPGGLKWKMLSEYLNSPADNKFSLRMHESDIRNGKMAPLILSQRFRTTGTAFLKFVLLNQCS